MGGGEGAEGARERGADFKRMGGFRPDLALRDLPLDCRRALVEVAEEDVTLQDPIPRVQRRVCRSVLDLNNDAAEHDHDVGRCFMSKQMVNPKSGLDHEANSELQKIGVS